MDSIKISASKDKGHRKALHTLQPAATDKEILVGADRVLKSNKSQGQKTKQNEAQPNNKTISKSTKVIKKNKGVQTMQEKKINIEADDLTTDNPSENYWQILAEKRKSAVIDTLEENKKLVQQIEKLKEENQVYKEMLDEMRTLVEVLQEQIEDRNNVNNSLDDSIL